MRVGMTFLWIVGLLATTGLFAKTASADLYDLIDPAGRVTATAEALPGRLIVLESTGERIYFSREPRYDSMDRKFVGFYNVELNRVLRFPRSGTGPMQLADLNDPSPRFRTTQRTVRPRLNNTPGNRPNPAAGYSSGYSPYDSSANLVPVPRAPRPQSVLIDSQTFRNPPLTPASLELTNGGPKELLVTLVDRKDASNAREIRIAPRQSTVVKIERDPGGRLVQTFRMITPQGESVTKEVVTQIAPEVRYDFVVHEWSMQSIAIDRTGKSPNVIEDINFQGKGLGRFPVPPGDRLKSGRIDVYRVAKQAGNQGTVAPITATEKPYPASSDSLERAIFEAQRKAQN